MGYVESNLMNGETIIHKAKIHWYIYIPAVTAIILGITLGGINLAMNNGSGAPVLGVLSLFMGIILLIKAFIVTKTTELAVTSKRIIAKVGLIRRYTIELSHGKVESFNVDQGIIGRLFGFGTLAVNGTGGANTAVPNISDPMGFRKKAMETIDSES